ncbi:MAG TPA: hypothetical protein PLR60_02970 [Syntrophorhabdaceae bacterium]|nr:hypothetical protein [Syntrophorhabdaceae bacterium]
MIACKISAPAVFPSKKKANEINNESIGRLKDENQLKRSDCEYEYYHGLVYVPKGLYRRKARTGRGRTEKNERVRV